MADSGQSTILQAIFRGIFGKCPKCGKGKIFREYLKVHSECGECNENLRLEGSDDAPAYLTIVILGHSWIPELVYLEMKHDMPLWLLTTLILPFTLGITLAILPRAKGGVIGILWYLKQAR